MKKFKVAYRLIRNPIIFTNIRIIFTDKQDATGRKMSVKSIFLMNIVNVEMEIAGADIKGKRGWAKTQIEEKIQ